MNKPALSMILLLIALTTAGAVAEPLSITESAPANRQSFPAADLVDIAASAGNFRYLVAALNASGLVDRLTGDETFTLFAPTDEAFAKLPAGDFVRLLEEPEELIAILTHHMVAGRKAAGDVTAADSLPSVQGQRLTVDTAGGLSIGGARILATDVQASNGVIHAIDTVLIPRG